MTKTHEQPTTTKIRDIFNKFYYKMIIKEVKFRWLLTDYHPQISNGYMDSPKFIYLKFL